MSGQPKITRAALAADQGIDVNAADAGRIDRTAAMVRTALDKAAPGTIFDTDPAHFDRYQIAAAGNGK